MESEKILEKVVTPLDLGVEKIHDTFFAYFSQLLFIITLEQVGMCRNDVIDAFVLHQHFLMVTSTLQRSPIYEVLTHKIVYSHHNFTLERHIEQFSPLDQESDVLFVLLGLPSVWGFLFLALFLRNLFFSNILIKTGWSVQFLVRKKGFGIG